MAGDKDPYTVARSKADPTKWAVYRNGQETNIRKTKKSSADRRALQLNIEAHGGPK